MSTDVSTKTGVDGVEALFQLLGLATEAQRRRYRSIGKVTTSYASLIATRVSSCTDALTSEQLSIVEEGQCQTGMTC